MHVKGSGPLTALSAEDQLSGASDTALSPPAVTRATIPHSRPGRPALWAKAALEYGSESGACTRGTSDCGRRRNSTAVARQEGEGPEPPVGRVPCPLGRHTFDCNMPDRIMECHSANSQAG